jgi:hypothetical protein
MLLLCSADIMSMSTVNHGVQCSTAASWPLSECCSWTYRCCEYAGPVLDEWPHIPLDCLSIQVGLEAVLGKARASDDQTLDDAPVYVPHNSCKHLQDQTFTLQQSVSRSAADASTTTAHQQQARRVNSSAHR